MVENFFRSLGLIKSLLRQNLIYRIVSWIEIEIVCTFSRTQKNR